MGAFHRFPLLRAEAGMLTVHHPWYRPWTRDGLDKATVKAQAKATVPLANPMCGFFSRKKFMAALSTR